jgi:polysaccharide export outer membrane protein
VVPQADRFQPELVRPSQITPPGIKVFVSNLTIPAANNASAAVSNREEGISVPYGSRFSHAVVATNCAGGTDINEDRKAILVRADRITGKTIAIERDVEDLMRNSDNNEENPLLMPKDSVACYDSSATNARDLFRTIGDILSPLNPILLFRNLFN